MFFLISDPSFLPFFMNYKMTPSNLYWFFMNFVCLIYLSGFLFIHEVKQINSFWMTIQISLWFHHLATIFYFLYLISIYWYLICMYIYFKNHGLFEKNTLIKINYKNQKPPFPYLGRIKLCFFLLFFYFLKRSYIIKCKNTWWSCCSSTSIASGGWNGREGFTTGVLNLSTSLGGWKLPLVSVFSLEFL